MKKLKPVIFLFVTITFLWSCSLASAAEDYGAKEFPGEKNVYMIEEVKMPQLDRNRRVWIYLPPDYHDSNKKYPVLYMQDGQNLFDDEGPYGSWKVNESLDRLFKEGETEGVIVVAVDHAGELRGQEYEYIAYHKQPNPLGEEYGEFLVNTLKPYIDQNYRTLPDREHTGIAGSSFGGKISLYVGLDYQEVFSRIGVFSLGGFTPIIFKDKIYYDKNQEMKIYLDIGTEEYEGEGPSFLKDVYEILLTAGLSEEELKLVIEDGAEHNEKAWARRFPEAFLWLFDN